MKDLKILDVYTKSDDDKISSFSDSLTSEVSLKHDFNIYLYDDEWISKMEEAMMYIDNILRNPNRFIINEEEVVKIELARRITVESIKHLSKNTNFIQDIDPVTGDVKPSKILNINKEENYNTYENRFVYSLIRNMKMYINKKKSSLLTNTVNKNEKEIEYKGNSKTGDEEIDIAVNFKSKLKSSKNNNETILKRIEKIELELSDLMSSELYMTIDKLRVSLVTSPIKKTNMILKNTNFQYAVSLWNYIHTHMDDNSRLDSGETHESNNESLKELMDESFMLNYLIADSVTNPEEDTNKKRRLSETLISNFIQKIVVTNSEITKEQLEKMIGEQYMIIKSRNLSTSLEIKKIFKTAINNYYKEIKENRLRGIYEEDKGK